MMFPQMTAVVVLALALPVVALAQEFPAREKKLPRGAQTAWETAVKKVEKNRKTYNEANEKALATLQRELERANPAVNNIAELVKEFQDGVSQLDAGARPPVPPPPEKDVVVFNGHRYQLFLENLSWEDAQKKCEAKGGHLLVIEEGREHTFLGEAIKQFSAQHPELPRNWHTWLGIKYDKDKDKWLTVNGQLQVYSAWIGKNAKDDRAVMRENGNWFSSNGAKADSVFFICEWDK